MRSRAAFSLDVIYKSLLSIFQSKTDQPVKRTTTRSGVTPIHASTSNKHAHQSTHRDQRPCKHGQAALIHNEPGISVTRPRVDGEREWESERDRERMCVCEWVSWETVIPAQVQTQGWTESLEDGTEEGWWDSFIIYLPLQVFISPPPSPTSAVTLPREPIPTLLTFDSQTSAIKCGGRLQLKMQPKCWIWRSRPKNFFLQPRSRQRTQGKRVCAMLCSDTAKPLYK